MTSPHSVEAAGFRRRVSNVLFRLQRTSCWRRQDLSTGAAAPHCGGGGAGDRLAGVDGPEERFWSPALYYRYYRTAPEKALLHRRESRPPVSRRYVPLLEPYERDCIELAARRHGSASLRCR